MCRSKIESYQSDNNGIFVYICNMENGGFNKEMTAADYVPKLCQKLCLTALFLSLLSVIINYAEKHSQKLSP